MSYDSTLHRDFFERFGELCPKVWFEIGLYGAGLNTNLITVPADPLHTLTRDTGFSGTDYSFEAPASVATSPVQLGVLPGDKLFISSGGTGNNENRLLTIESVTTDTLVVRETLNSEEGLTPYGFKILRRSTGVFTNLGREWLTSLISWQVIGDIDLACQTKRVEWVVIGGGTQPESKSVSRIANYLYVSITEGEFEISSVLAKHILSSFPFSFGVRFNVEFLENEVVDYEQLPFCLVQEAGLGVGDASEELPYELPLIAYKTFSPLTKTPDFRLEVQWDLVF